MARIIKNVFTMESGDMYIVAVLDKETARAVERAANSKNVTTTAYLDGLVAWAIGEDIPTLPSPPAIGGAPR